MDWFKYYQDQIYKSIYNRLNKVDDFMENKTKGLEGGFFNPFWEVKKLSQQVSNLQADETKNKRKEKFIDNQNEMIKINKNNVLIFYFFINLNKNMYLLKIYL